MSEEPAITLREKQSLTTYERYRGRILTPNEWLERQLEARIKNGFSEIASWQPDHPKLQEICDYGRTVDEKIALLQKPVGLSPALAAFCISRISPEAIKPEFNHLILRLRKNTNYLKELEDTGIAAALLTGLENGKYGAFVKFLAPDSFLAASGRKRGASAGYLAGLDIALVYDKPPTPEEMWLSMATEGKIPETVIDLEHELVHDKQWTKAQRIFFTTPSLAQIGGHSYILQKYGVWAATAFTLASNRLLKVFRKSVAPERILAEIHAFEASASNPAYLDEALDEKNEIVFHILSAYEKNDAKRFAAGVAFDSIHTLRILGLDDQEIGKLVSRAKFNRKARVYPSLEKRIAQERSRWGVEDERDFRFVRQALLARHDLELRVQRHHAKEIAAEQLKIAAGLKGWLREEKTSPTS